MLNDDLLRAIATAPFESVTDVIMGRNSGVKQPPAQRQTSETEAVAVACNADDNQEENQKENRSRKKLAKAPQAEIEGCRFRTCAEASRNIAKALLAPVATISAVAVSANDGCAEKDHVARIRFGRGRFSGRFFVGGKRFAG